MYIRALHQLHIFQMFAIVEFPSTCVKDDVTTISAIPQSWLLDDNACKWPPGGADKTKYIQNCISPDVNWKIFKCEVKKTNSKLM